MEGFIKFDRDLFSVCNGTDELGAALTLLRMTDNKEQSAVITLRSLASEWGGKWNKDNVKRFLMRLSDFFYLSKNENGETTIVRQECDKSATRMRQSCDKSATPNNQKDSKLKRPLRQSCDKSATRMRQSCDKNATPPILELLDYIDYTPLTPLKGGVPPTIAKIYANFDFSFVDDSLMSCFADWLLYKHDELKFTYKTQTSLEVCYKDLKTKSDGDPVTARMIVEQSIANGWKGLFKLKNDYGQTTTNGYGQGDNAQFLQQAAAYISTIRDGDFDSDRPPV